MGTLNWTVEAEGNRNKNVAGSQDNASGAATTSTSEGAVSGLTPQAGQIVTLTASEEMWVRFGGRTAAVGTGKYIPANVPMSFEVSTGDSNKAVSAIDVS